MTTSVDVPMIRLLPPHVASRIAAGEVVERPVSVVRELLDNAIDAAATRVDVEVEEGGVALIRVADNGIGIPPQQVEVAFERHATSKIADEADLRCVRTLGFRGEALPAIAAAGDVELVSRAAGEPVGVQLVLVDGAPVRRRAKPAPVGTSLTVRDLFGRVPARRKFLAAPASEARRIAVLVAHYALAYPGIAFKLTSGGRRLLQTSGDSDLRHAFAAVYGADVAAAMLDVDHIEERVAVAGLCGPSSVHRGNRSGISVFVNGRWVQSRPLLFAVADAYQSELPGGRFPLAALDVRLPAEEVDVNVHPAKAEVRFRNERAVTRAVRHAIRAALEGAPPVRSTLALASGTVSAGPADERPLRERLLPQALAPAALRGPQPAQGPLWPGLAQSAEGDNSVRPTHRETLPLLRVVGQMALTYIVAEGPDGMYLIDQHAAHERVLYDRLVARAGSPARQPLLEPVAIEPGPALAATLEEHREHLAGLGLDIEPFGDASFLVRAVPADLGSGDIAGALQALLEQLAGEQRVAEPFGRAAATVACHGSVRAGMALALEEMRQLVEDLEATTSPRTCPHGRPTMVVVARESLERQFGRR
ncbi:MAG: DNA mismatch repair endonuclease MutL [Dehalococcoidia bacterium]